MRFLARAVSGARGGSSAPGRPGRTHKLDQALVERYRKNPAAFQRSTERTLYVALALLVFAALLAAAAIKLVGLAAGGLAVLTIVVFPVLLALTALDDYRWRKELHARDGVPPPAPPPIWERLRHRNGGSAKGRASGPKTESPSAPSS